RVDVLERARVEVVRTPGDVLAEPDELGGAGADVELRPDVLLGILERVATDALDDAGELRGLGWFRRVFLGGGRTVLRGRGEDQSERHAAKTDPTGHLLPHHRLPPISIVASRNW